MAAGPDKVSIAVHAGIYDRVHYALVLAAAAAAVGTPVTLFFTQWGTRALLRPAADGSPGWHALALGPEAGDAARTAAELDALLAERRVGTFEELLLACGELGVRFLVCESGLIGAGVAAEDLRDDLPIEVTGAVSFLRDVSPGGATFFV